MNEPLAILLTVMGCFIVGVIMTSVDKIVKRSKRKKRKECGGEYTG